ncbi:MAG: hypothetical protein AUK54_07160 [Helicobacteraceae bacterium CG2_30_36_10]|nr:MAG: hypothetical protein AUK54_07160 [Helicobacteraceae bacterium CG2_30_36_10]
MISLKQFSNGFEYLEVINKVAKAKIALQGAHIFQYTKIGQKPLLWLSEVSEFKVGRAIRGGVALCWPWFGMNKTDINKLQHGFVRTMIWQLLESNETDDCTELTLILSSSKETMRLWPHKFELLYKIKITNELTLELITKNCDLEAFTITQALHTYFNISNILKVYVSGLENKPYFDSLEQENYLQSGSLLFNKEVDSIMHPKIKTTKSSFLIPPTYDTCSSSFSPLEFKLLSA